MYVCVYTYIYIYIYIYLERERERHTHTHTTYTYIYIYIHVGPLVFLISTKCGGTGLNLTAANAVVIGDQKMDYRGRTETPHPQKSDLTNLAKLDRSE